jgi:hypothetical protein
MPVPPNWSQTLRAFVAELKAKPAEHLPAERLGDGPFDKFVLTEHAGGWEEFIEWLNELQGTWCFRGQRESEWLLHTSLDRAGKVEHSSKTGSGYYHLDREMEGRDLLFRFQQRAHDYIHCLPPREDLSSWFALMQHHGVPTRLLDWTQSAYVAMYFAVEEKPQKEKRRCALWAIDLDWLEDRARQLLRSAGTAPEATDANAGGEYVNRLLGQTEKPIIVSINPPYADERGVAQQGLFLCRLYHQATFNKILMTMMIHPETPDRPVVRKLEVAGDHRIEFLKRLRAMNIHRASLFPDLDGFGQSLRLDLEIKAGDEAAKVAAEPSISELREMRRKGPAAEEGEVEFDTYCVECVRDQKHGERFVIVLVDKAKMKGKFGPFDEEGVRAKMKELGLPGERIEENIRRARVQADEEERGG